MISNIHNKIYGEVLHSFIETNIFFNLIHLQTANNFFYFLTLPIASCFISFSNDQILCL